MNSLGPTVDSWQHAFDQSDNVFCQLCAVSAVSCVLSSVGCRVCCQLCSELCRLTAVKPPLLVSDS